MRSVLQKLDIANGTSYVASLLFPLSIPPAWKVCWYTEKLSNIHKRYFRVCFWIKLKA